MLEPLFAKTHAMLRAKPFAPHRLFSGGDAQTLAAFAWPRSFRFHDALRDEERLFEVEPGIKVLAQCRWKETPTDHSTMVLWHGMEGSISSNYMLATADKAFKAGFNVVRVNFRNCGNTEHLTPTIYHGGLSSDLGFVINELINKDHLKRLFLVGFSLGGNLVLKLAGEYGPNYPREVLAACAISPSVDLQASADRMALRRNWIYHARFLRHLKIKITIKSKLYPDLYDITGLHTIKTLRAFDERYVSRAAGFTSCEDYYYGSSALRLAKEIRIPTLIIHAQDDPFIPYQSLCEQDFQNNPNILIAGPDNGGHVAFIGNGFEDEDRFWAENRTIDFCKVAETELTSESS